MIKILTNVINTFQANDAGIYISGFYKRGQPGSVQAYYGLVNFDSTLYLNKIASQIGHVSQLHFQILPVALRLETHMQ